MKADRRVDREPDEQGDAQTLLNVVFETREAV
jgi:hypothetical protein